MTKHQKATWTRVAVRGDERFAYLFSTLGHDAMSAYNVNFGSRFERCAMVVKREGGFTGNFFEVPGYGFFLTKREVEDCINHLTTASA